jgi:hypothetical protein
VTFLLDPHHVWENSWTTEHPEPFIKENGWTWEETLARAEWHQARWEAYKQQFPLEWQRATSVLDDPA